VDEQMYDLVDQKWAALRAVDRRGATSQDREAQHKTVEAVLAEAALANAQLAVVKAVLRSATSAVKAEFRPEAANVEALSRACRGQSTANAEEAVEKMTTQLVFGRVPAQTQTRQRCGKPEVKVLYCRGLFEAEEDDSKAILPASVQPVQLAMFDL
jgi:hypothetical protein